MDWFEEAKGIYVPGKFGYKQIAKKYGISHKTVESRFQREKRKGIVYEDRKPEPTQDDVMAAYDAFKNLDNILDKLDTKQTKTTITLPDNKPVAIAFWGDWHIGARGVDYKAFDRDMRAIIDTEGLYFIGMGDYKDNQNALVHSNGVTEQIATPGIQDLLVKSFFMELKEKALAIIRGCHDDWDKKTSDKDFISTLCSEEVADSVNLWHGGGITIKLGSQQYKIRARHKYKGESELNTTNSQRRLLDSFGPSDVIAVAHKHYPDMQMLDRMEQKVIYFRSGCYKVYDEFGQKIGGYKGKWGVPVAIIKPDEKKVIPFEDLYEAITHLKALRS